MESSNSSDEEDLDKFREAVDTKFINDSMFQENKETESINDKQLPSLRPVKDDQEQFNLLNVTPGFQNYVAKRLSEHLEKKLHKKLSTDVEYQPEKKRKKKGGIKLFSDSKDYLSLKIKNNIDLNLKKVEIKKRSIENDHDISDDVKIRLCAVNSEDILSKNDVKYWTEHRKSEVFSYKCGKNGTLICVDKDFE